MSYFENVYKPRLNRDGTNFNERILSRRRREFLDYIKKSIYKIEFEYEGEELNGVLIPNKHDQRKASAFLNLPFNNAISIGSIIPCEKNDTEWLAVYLEADISLGYNKYYMMLINGVIQWTEFEKKSPVHSSQCALTGPTDKIVKDKFSHLASGASYREDDKEIAVLLPYSDKLTKDSYVTIEKNDRPEYFTLTGFDASTQEGLIYLSLNARPKRDETVTTDLQGPWYNYKGK